MRYLTTIRPDIAFVVCKLTQLKEKPREIHWKTVRKVLRYLVRTQELGIVLKKTKKIEISAFGDADWAADIIHRRSHPGYLIYVGDSLVVWRSKKQLTIARPNTESEFRARRGLLRFRM